MATRLPTFGHLARRLNASLLIIQTNGQQKP